MNIYNAKLNPHFIHLVNKNCFINNYLNNINYNTLYKIPKQLVFKLNYTSL